MIVERECKGGDRPGPHYCSGFKRSQGGGAALGVMTLLAVTLWLGLGASARAQGINGNGAGFEIDDVGTLFSGDGGLSGIAAGDDWAQGPGFMGVLLSNGDPKPGFNAKLQVDQNWGNRGDGSDATKFDGKSNKNNDLIGPLQAPWQWDGVGGGPQKNDITNSTITTRVDAFGDRWIFVSAETRSTKGDSHVDFEFLQAGLTQTGAIAGQLIGNGPTGGRTIFDFIISIDFVQGGGTPETTVRVWDGTQYVVTTPPAGSLFTASNLMDINHVGGWGHFQSNGAATDIISALQLVEAGVNLDALGITDLDVCNTESELIVKTRSSQSFTAELKDFNRIPFPLEPTPTCSISGNDSVCPGDRGLVYKAMTDLTGVTFAWTISGDGSIVGPADQSMVTVDADMVCDGRFTLSVTIATEFCESTCDFIVTIDDDEAPVITCPADVTLECPADTSPNNTGTATFTDNCGNVTLRHSDVRVPGCGNTVTITRTWTATDFCGNSASCVQTITVVDTTPPTINCPADVTLECPADTTPSNTGTATGSDTCGTVTISHSDVSVPGCGNTATITRTWTATDQCGNQASCVQTIRVVDTTPPTINCPADATLECPADTSVAANGSATGSDTCGTVTISHSDVRVPGCGNTETITRTWTATDQCGNQASCVQTIRVVDTTRPTINCPADVTLECPADTTPSNTGTASGSDTCGSVTISHNDVRVPGCGNTETITRTWTATDECGNTASCVQTITVVDTTSPTISGCPGDQALSCNQEFRFTITAMDACGPIASITATFSSATPERVVLTDLGGGNFSVELTSTATAIITVVATDACGNVSAACVFTVSAVCNEACSPGYWRNHPGEFCGAGFVAMDGDCFAGSTATDFADAFGLVAGDFVAFANPNITLFQAVNTSGGDFNQLLFHGSASLLGAAHSVVDFPFSVSQVQAIMQQAANGTISIQMAKNIFATAISVAEADGGCPLS